ncbi:MAG: sugar-binding domain-containing protein [Armatimonadota bacterium]|jgi:hypothetical protein
MKSTRLTIIVALLLALTTTAAVVAQDADALRMRLLRGDATVGELAGALDHADVIVARTAARLLPARGGEARAALDQALRHDDVLVRRSAAMNLHALGTDGLELVERALRDEHGWVRQGAVFSLMRMEHSTEVAALLDVAREDETQIVRSAALLATRSAYRTADAIRLPADGWRFRLDPERVGRDQGWFAADLDDRGWDQIAIEQPWQEVGYDYVGVAWYRRSIELPDREAPARVSLDFQGVDESTWVWVNGQFAGEHDIGPTGWDKPFRIDVTDLLRWGEENQITIRAMNTANLGGIWRPVSLVLLEPAGG